MTVPALLLAILLVAFAMAKNDDSASGMLERLEERRNQFILRGSSSSSSGSSSDSSGSSSDSSSSDSSTDDDDDERTFDSSSKGDRIRARIFRNAQEEIARANRAAEQAALRRLEGEQRKSFQAKFTRGPTTSPSPCPTQTEFVGNSTVNQTFVSSCVSLEIGPMIIIGKTSSAPVEADVFDGDLDGKLDVEEALRQLERANGTKSLSNGNPVVNRLSDFLFSVRNRAQVNGGSIELTSLVLTGRFEAPGVTSFPINSNANVAPAFLTFGQGKTLISPCIPILLDEDFNLDIYGVIQGFFGLATTQQISGSAFFVNGDESQGFIDTATVPFNVTATRLLNTTIGGNTLRGGIFNPTGNEPIGTVVFEPCQAFSYFQ
jgi:hypothetical protein